MTDPVALGIIAAIQVIILAGINAIVASRNHADTQKSVKAVEVKVAETQHTIDGRMGELIAASKAQGAQDQRQETRADAKEMRQEFRQDAKDAKP
jgi:hypothetical protein